MFGVAARVVPLGWKLQDLLVGLVGGDTVVWCTMIRSTLWEAIVVVLLHVVTMMFGRQVTVVRLGHKWLYPLPGVSALDMQVWCIMMISL